jgi:hypothetical protein
MDTRITKTLAGLAVFGGLAVGGAEIGNAASSRSAATTTSTTTAAPSFPAHGSAAHEDAEKPVTGDAASKAQAAAVKAAGGGTAEAVTSDFPGTGYEVTVTKSDGSTVEVHLDSSFNVLQGGPGGHGFGGPPHGSAEHENAETAVTGDAATNAQAAAVKAVGGGTAGAVTTDFQGNGYEVTVAKSDGSTVEVHLDSSFNVLQGGPGGPGGFRDHGPRGFGGFPGGGSAGSPGSAGTF